MVIRLETPEDIADIRRLTKLAFAPMPFSSGTETGVIDALRRAGDLTLSLVALDREELIGHAAFSPVKIDGQHNGLFGLGPISVERERQRQGVGKALIFKGLEILRDRGALGCVLIGDPDIYSRAGFLSDGRLRYRDLEPKLVQYVVLNGDMPAGTIKFAPALEV